MTYVHKCTTNYFLDHVFQMVNPYIKDNKIHRFYVYYYLLYIDLPFETHGLKNNLWFIQ